MPQEFSRLARLFSALAGFTLLAACGGGGGGASTGNPNPTPAPTVTLTANPTSITAGQTVTLTWSSTNATSCSASGGWSGAKAISGTEVSAALSGATTFSLNCTGTGGSTSASVSVSLVSPPALTFTAAQTAITTNYPTTLTWSSTNATACTASGGWTGARPTSGTDSTGLVAAASTFTLTCTGPGGSTSQQVNVTVTTPAAGQIVVSGRVTFDRLPFNATLGTGLSSTPVASPAREVVVEISGALNASTTSDAGGYYAFTAAESSSVTLRARAQLLRTGSPPTWNFRVLNNTNSDALYVLQGPTFNTGTTYAPNNLSAGSGFNGTTYTGVRAAAPFAILDTVYNAKQLILSADAAAVLPPLNLYWSSANRPASPFCADQGDIGTSFYFSDPSGTATDDCSAPLPEGIYILGDFANGNGDTDEFDAHVIAHEFGHYFEDRFSRSDSIGGQHTLGDRLDLRVAFGEGWGNAFGAMSLGDPQYRDSSSGISDDFGFNLETDSANNQGWFSEASVGEILWDIFDNNSTPESGDTVALGFAPVFAVMTGPQVNTDALTSIFTFATALRAANSSASGAIADLLSGEQIAGNNAFGANETNIGGDPSVLPVYQDIALNSPLTNVCSRAISGSDGNKLGNRHFLRFDNSQARLVSITLTGAATSASAVAATDPDVYVFRRGALVAVGDSGDPGRESLTQIQLGVGTHILEVYDFDISDSGTNQPARCMTVSISGN